jgi:hypothetical protein
MSTSETLALNPFLPEVHEDPRRGQKLGRVR